MDAGPGGHTEQIAQAAVQEASGGAEQYTERQHQGFESFYSWRNQRKVIRTELKLNRFA